MSEQIFIGLTPDQVAVEVAVKRGKICRVTPVQPQKNLPYILPVLVDLQHNGSLGISYQQIQQPEDLHKIATFLLRHGVGKCLPTSPTVDFEQLCRQWGHLTELIENDRTFDRLFVNFFNEGSFISRDDGWRGAHLPQEVCNPDWELFQHFEAATHHRCSIINVAPEEPGALKFIEQAAAAGKKISLGHAHPDTATIREAVQCGASLVTHFGNGAAPLIHRFRNPFWEMLNNTQLSLGLIGDGFHLPSELVQVALRQKDWGNCFMVSDANMYAGLPPGTYQDFMGVSRVIEPTGFLHVANSEILAGASQQLDRGVEFLIQNCGLDFWRAWQLCSTIPAQIAGIELPPLQEQADALFVLAYYNESDHSVRIDRTIFYGDVYPGEHGNSRI